VLRDRGVRLFMISNCSATGLDTFLTYTGLRPYFTDWLSMGATGADKDVNIRTLVGRYNLERAAYVGDVQRDADHAHAARGAHHMGTLRIRPSVRRRLYNTHVR